MTEGHEDDFLVRVRAQVMSRDESTEGWLPLSGGGMAHVSIRKRARMPDIGHEYIIYGQRISDQTVILSCVINRDLQYFKVMPTFHHWRAGKQRNGLTFQTAADARAFDKGIIRAYDDLIDGIDNKTQQSWDKYDSLVGEDDVFMTLDLPCEPSESRSNSEGSNGSQKSDKLTPHITYISPLPSSTQSPSLVTDDKARAAHTSIYKHSQSSSSPSPPPMISPTTITSPKSNSTAIPTISQHTANKDILDNVDDSTKLATTNRPDNYSYVELTNVHDFNYPLVEDPTIIRATQRKDSTCSLKKGLVGETLGGSIGHGINSPTSAFTGGIDSTSIIVKDTGSPPLKTRLRCRYCMDGYAEAWNRRGACEFAPDCFRDAIEAIPGMTCARGLVYHCMRDPEGDTINHPCVCSSENGGLGCTKRWIGLTLLSLLLPCLWCYPPLRALHYAGVACGICGGRHKPNV